jgi:hypothetical protein
LLVMTQMTTKRELDRERARQAREKVLQLLQSTRVAADPVYVIGAAGFWLQKAAAAPDPRRNFRLREGDRVPMYFGA